MGPLETAASAIIAVVGAVVALGGLLGTIGRMSQVARARRRVHQAAALQKEADASLSKKFEDLHKEESARYLAVVEGRIGRATGWTAAAAVGALLSATIVLMTTLDNASTPHIWDETISMLVAYGPVCLVLTGVVLYRSSERRRAFIRAYRTHVGPDHTEASAPEDRLGKLVTKFGDTSVQLAVAVVTALLITLFFAASGHFLGREYTEAGLAMKTSDGPRLSLVVSVAPSLLFIAAGIGGVLLFPGLPRAGETLRKIAKASAAQEESVDVDSGQASDASDVSPSTPQGPPGS